MRVGLPSSEQHKRTNGAIETKSGRISSMRPPCFLQSHWPVIEGISGIVNFISQSFLKRTMLSPVAMCKRTMVTKHEYKHIIQTSSGCHAQVLHERAMCTLQECRSHTRCWASKVASKGPWSTTGTSYALCLMHLRFIVLSWGLGLEGWYIPSRG